MSKKKKVEDLGEDFDYYGFLAIDSTATPAQIRQAYRKEALKCHPDKVKSREAELRYDQLGKCRDFLMDDEKRTAFDNRVKAKSDRKRKHALEDESMQRMRAQLERKEKEAKVKLDERQEKNFANLTKQQNIELINQLKRDGVLKRPASASDLFAAAAAAAAAATPTRSTSKYGTGSIPNTPSTPSTPSSFRTPSTPYTPEPDGFKAKRQKKESGPSDGTATISVKWKSSSSSLHNKDKASSHKEQEKARIPTANTTAATATATATATANGASASGSASASSDALETLTVTEASLRDMLRAYGTIEDVVLRPSKRMALVSFADAAQAAKAALHTVDGFTFTSMAHTDSKDTHRTPTANARAPATATTPAAPPSPFAFPPTPTSTSKLPAFLRAYTVPPSPSPSPSASASASASPFASPLFRTPTSNSSAADDDDYEAQTMMRLRKAAEAQRKAQQLQA
jgi:curved DNA-binding protein CbpA